MSNEPTKSNLDRPGQVSPWRVIGWLCLIVIVTCLVVCISLVSARSNGLTGVKITANKADDEPRDHDVPLIKQREALPDFQIVVMTHDRRNINLGTKPDSSATEGLEWTLNDPISITDIASVRLQDEDKLVSDVLAEVQISERPVEAGNYRFVFSTERAMSIGLQSFFNSPMGIAIATAFFITVLLMLLSVVRG